MALSTTRRMTADEFFALPGEQPHTELIDGEIVVNEPNLRHQRIAGWIYYQLMRHAEAHPEHGEPGLEADTPIDDDNVFVPDAWWTVVDHIPARDAERLVGPPDLAVEVRSPSTWRYDVGLKLSRWEAAGLPELWLVDTEADTVLVYRRSAPGQPRFDVALEVGAGEMLTTPLIPGFALDIGVLFDR